MVILKPLTGRYKASKKILSGMINAKKKKNVRIISANLIKQYGAFM